jgi:hypothetical protein
MLGMLMNGALLAHYVAKDGKEMPVGLCVALNDAHWPALCV